jgi:hypothetical protein
VTVYHAEGVLYWTLLFFKILQYDGMAKAKGWKRQERETPALLRAEMAEPRKARSVRDAEAKLQASELKAAKALRARKSGVQIGTDRER